jgi:TPR repeat protein
MTHGRGVSISLVVVIACACGDKKDEPRPSPSPSPSPTPPAPTPDCKHPRYNDGIDACKAVCEAGSMEACWIAGELYEWKPDDPGAQAPAIPLYIKACDGGYGDACERMANFYHQGLAGLPKDEVKRHAYYAKAIPLWTKECGEKRPTSCFQLGDAYENGLGTALDKTKATESYNKACDAGSRGGCAKVERPPPREQP